MIFIILSNFYEIFSRFLDVFGFKAFEICRNVNVDTSVLYLFFVLCLFVLIQMCGGLRMFND